MGTRELYTVIRRLIGILIAGDGLLGNMLLVGYRDIQQKRIGSGLVVWRDYTLLRLPVIFT